MPAHIDLSGSVFNGIAILHVSHVNIRSEYHYVCRCHCGKEFVAPGYRIRVGRLRSCGCINEALQHGRVGTSEHGIWAAMKTRCLNPNSPAFPDYGGRGITVCDRWLDFRNFFADMGKRPSKNHSIDRIDNNKGYSPDNVRWATMKMQALNRRNNKKPKRCENCGAPFFYTNKSTQLFCSYKCRGVADTKGLTARLKVLRA